MQHISKKTFYYLSIVIVAMLPELAGGKLEAWCELKLGVNWLPIVLVIALLVIGINELFERLQAAKKSQEQNNQPAPKPEDISDFYPKIKEYLRSRYQSRIDQKLAWRQPVNLRRLPFHFAKANTANLPFVKYDGDEVKEALAENFEMGNGRLLVLGDAGTGKTTLLLQLALELMKTQPQALPVVVNLATWTSKFTKLHDWLLAVLPAETGANKTLAIQLLLEKRLVLLFDGFDEIQEEDRRSCLDAIGQYGIDARHRYVISSRKKEYLEVTTDAPVYFPIEVGHLKIEEIEADLESMGHKEPEALRLLAAIRQDAHLREAVQTPFYLNSLQLLFAKSKNRQDFQFKAKSLKGRKQEIVERFVVDALQTPSKQANDLEAAKRWLGFLASRMTRNNKVVFELVDLQYDWWEWGRWQRMGAGLVVGLIYGLIYGLVYELFGMLADGVASGLASGLFSWIDILWGSS